MAVSLKLSPELKARVAAISKKCGVSPHAFMIDAIVQQAERSERRQRFLAEALAAEKELMETGEGFSADEVHSALDQRARQSRSSRRAQA